MTKRTILTIALVVLAIVSKAQETKIEVVTDNTSAQDSTIVVVDSLNNKDNKTYVSLGSGGIRVSTKTKDLEKDKKRVELHYLGLDLGVNMLNDLSNYAAPQAQAFLNVSPDKQNANLFALNPGKSVNVNIWPVLAEIKLMRNKHQKISLYTGAGMQFYNFRFNKNISILNETVPTWMEDSVKFTKNKLAFAYASIPVMLNFKTRMSKDVWLTYGAGVIGGYAFDIWTKQISAERGKQKNHDAFNFNRFNMNLCGEVGLAGIIRFYATYQLTNIYQNSLDQRPFCIGIRFLGI